MDCTKLLVVAYCLPFDMLLLIREIDAFDSIRLVRTGL
jgi:hypothetical protein